MYIGLHYLEKNSVVLNCDFTDRNTHQITWLGLNKFQMHNILLFNRNKVKSIENKEEDSKLKFVL